MDKIFLIFQREFLTRVRKKSFLLTTILLPVLIFGIYLAIFYFMVYDGTQTKIAVVDNAGIFSDTIPGNKDAEFIFVNGLTQQQLAQQIQEKKYSGFLVTSDSIDDKTPIQLTTGESLGIMAKDNIQKSINERLRQMRVNNMSPQQREAIEIERANREVQFVNMQGDDESNIKSGISYIIGMISGYLIFFILLIYGAIVMRGVMEEKINRIAEVIVSSVKPFQLMMGKILGIGAVGLVQFFIWIVLALILQALAAPLMLGDSLASITGGAGRMDNMQDVFTQLNDINFPLIIALFIIYFLGGYLLYAALYAIIGCAVSESEEDAQKLTLPITLPLIIGFVMLTKAVNMPNGSLAVFGSMFPLTSPIVMMGRVAQGVPAGVTYWELALSIFILIASFILASMLAAKIYRVGILMYGKKPTWKEIIRWGFRKS
ncbi:ABC transporter permease [Haoranjiania flava]|uniref:ABC transporter permease n=1 Tax=Haoranjiania flava TaxID=1856322 RepID=A0AAE3IS44_9BACT|nr:ABC transporter permease [Haoranjiania flava]MCU7695386.1 ABC transporter permease [Haoranjiania flava]